MRSRKMRYLQHSFRSGLQKESYQTKNLEIVSQEVMGMSYQEYQEKPTGKSQDLILVDCPGPLANWAEDFFVRQLVGSGPCIPPRVASARVEFCVFLNSPVNSLLVCRVA